MTIDGQILKNSFRQQKTFFCKSRVFQGKESYTRDMGSDRAGPGKNTASDFMFPTDPFRGTREFEKRPIILVIIIASLVFFALGKITSDSDSNGGKMHLGRAFMKIQATVRGKQPHTTLVQKKLFANGGSLYPW